MATLFLFIGTFKFRSPMIHVLIGLTKERSASFIHGSRIRKLIRAKLDIILAKDKHYSKPNSLRIAAPGFSLFKPLTTR